MKKIIIGVVGACGILVAAQVASKNMYESKMQEVAAQLEANGATYERTIVSDNVFTTHTTEVVSFHNDGETLSIYLNGRVQHWPWGGTYTGDFDLSIHKSSAEAVKMFEQIFQSKRGTVTGSFNVMNNITAEIVIGAFDATSGSGRAVLPEDVVVTLNGALDMKEFTVQTVLKSYRFTDSENSNDVFSLENVTYKQVVTGYESLASDREQNITMNIGAGNFTYGKDDVALKNLNIIYSDIITDGMLTMNYDIDMPTLKVTQSGKSTDVNAKGRFGVDGVYIRPYFEIVKHARNEMMSNSGSDYVLKEKTQARLKGAFGEVLQKSHTKLELKGVHIQSNHPDFENIEADAMMKVNTTDINKQDAMTSNPMALMMVWLPRIQLDVDAKGVTLPRAALKKLQLNEGDPIKLTFDKGALTVNGNSISLM